MADQTRTDVAFLYRRAGFGLRPDELDRLAAGGYEAAVEQLTAGLAAPDPAGDRIPAPQINSEAPTRPTDQASRRQQGAILTKEVRALQQWWMDRMIATSTPLREKLTLFWHGHFATSVSKVRDPRLMYLQNQLFRTAGAGGFEALVGAVARDGAMMIWLDTGSDRATHPNENFARELQELFTLGVGNYTQDDVTAAARAFTGWAFDRAAYRYRFRAAQHDYGTKTYLGQTGAWNGDDIIRIAVTRPESAHFVLARIWSHFAYPVEPADPVVADLVTAYGSGLDLTAALRAVFLHPAFRSPAARTGLVKQPVEYLAGAARALGLDASLGGAHRSLPQMAGALGQELFRPPNVGGWGQNSYWLSSATAQLRLDIALSLARAADLSVVESAPAAQRPTVVADLIGLDGWGPTTAAALNSAAAQPALITALALVSPEYVLA